MRFPAVLPIFALFVAMGLIGCTTTEVYEPDAAPEYLVMKEFSPFYQDGPMQPRGPDLSLRINERVKLLKKDFTGFAFVEISDGRRGYVAIEELAPAPPRPRETVETASARSSSGRRLSISEAAYSGPQMNDIPLPNPSAPPVDLNVGPEEIPVTPVPSMIDTEPTSETKPKFRY